MLLGSGTDPRGMTGYVRPACVQMFAAAPFITAPHLNNPKVHEQVACVKSVLWHPIPRKKQNHCVSNNICEPQGRALCGGQEARHT